MRTKKQYLGIDIGTTSLKAAVFDEDGNRLGLRKIDYTLNTDSQSGFIEFEAEDYIRMCEQAIAELTNECGRLDAISVDTQGETLILADRSGNALARAVIWLDNRAVREAELIANAFGKQEIYHTTGQPEITAGWPASKLLWFRRNRKELFDRTEKIFLLEDWVLYRLTGNFVTEPTIQSSSLYFDIEKKDWWQPMLDFCGVRREQLPTICESAEQIGFYHGIPVVSGALDQIAGMIGTGITDSGSISEMTGTIMAVCSMTDRIPAYREDSIIPCHIHAIPGQYCRLLWSPTAGMALKWFRSEFAENYDFAQLDALAEKISPGCDGLTVLPYFCGSTMPKYRPEATAMLAGLRLCHTRAHVARAIMESVAFLLRQQIEYLDNGETLRQIRITGGGASSPLWAQIKADVTGKTLCTVREKETACMGSAILAAVGIGDYRSVSAAAQKLVVPDCIYTPSGTDYGEAYRRFADLDNRWNP